MSKHTAILDIGSSKVLCIICSPDEKGEIIVHGAGVCGYRGYRHGAFLDERKLKNTIIEAIEKAIALTELNNQYKRYKDELVTKKTSSL